MIVVPCCSLDLLFFIVVDQLLPSLADTIAPLYSACTLLPLSLLPSLSLLGRYSTRFSDDAVGSRRKFARRFVEEIEKLSTNTKGDHWEKDRRLSDYTGVKS
ncbi:hypothetical protein GW17_00017057 [Ensete ventricosum]|nr:hypothetical protein GW17_00017057 [Ensete ventricosum]